MPEPESIDALIERRYQDLIAYQDKAYADRYRSFVEDVRRTEAMRIKGESALSEAVVRYLYKLMAYKDEYEVARLYTDGEFIKALGKRFKGGMVKFHLAPPLLAKHDPVTGHLRKRLYGPWMMTAFRLLAGLKFLRGTALDPFGLSEERKRERALVEDYRQSIGEIMAGLNPDNHALAVEIASIPEQIRGYGHVKERHLGLAKRKWADLMAAYRAGRSAPSSIAAE
jgi:indolepyruvate ferredoxin oxidoreductase